MDQSLGDMCTMRDNNSLVMTVLNLSRNKKRCSSSRAFIKRNITFFDVDDDKEIHLKLHCNSTIKTSLKLPEMTRWACQVGMCIKTRHWLRSFVDVLWLNMESGHTETHTHTHTHTCWQSASGVSSTHTWCHSHRPRFCVLSFKRPNEISKPEESSILYESRSMNQARQHPWAKQLISLTCIVCCGSVFWRGGLGAVIMWHEWENRNI